MTKLLRPHERILLVTASTAAELGAMFVRPQEFYESPSRRFRGRYFTLEAFKKFYRRRTGAGSFTYYRDYQGYNIPGEVFLDWQADFASNESPEELALLTLLGPMPGQFYIIGALEKDVNTIEHELQHALFHLAREYREVVTAQLALSRSLLRPLCRALKKLMYTAEMLDDECVSYLLFEEPWMRRAGVALKPLKFLRLALMLDYKWASHAYLKPRSKW